MKKIKEIMNNTKFGSGYMRYAILLLGIIFLYIINESFFGSMKYQLKEKLFFVLIVILGIEIVIELVKKEKDLNRIIVLILSSGIVIRIGFMVYTDISAFGHDLGIVEIKYSKLMKGNIQYIQQILSGKLPSSNQGQYYHPPLFYICSAAIVRIVQIFIPVKSAKEIMDITKIVSTFASCVSLFIIHSIGKELSLSKKNQILLVGFAAFFPIDYLICVYGNNDALTAMFGTIITLYSIKWYQDSSWKNTVALALAFGFGMMSKFSIAVCSLPTGMLMLYKGYFLYKKGKFKDYIIRMTAFLGIAAPLGLWYSLRNYLLFHQQLGYVLRVDKKQIHIYRGNYSAKEILFQFGWKDFWNTPFNQVRKDYKLVPYCIKSALFGEYAFFMEFFSRILLFIYIIILILLFVAMGIQLKKFKQNGMITLYLSGSVLLWIGCYIWFNLEYRASCSMDFRYFVPILASATVLLARTGEYLTEKHAKIYEKISMTCMILFGICSILVYTNL